MWAQGSCRTGGLGTSAWLEVLFCPLDTKETDLEEVRPRDPEILTVCTGHARTWVFAI